MIPYINKPFSKARLKQLVSWTLLRFGPSKTVVLVEKLKDLGYVYATCAGISLGIDDLLVPTQKVSHLRRAKTELRSNEDDVYRGHLTSVQYFSRVINVWTYTNEVIKNELIHDFKQNDTLNPVYMMAFSGARGNISQVRQLVGMRGLMSDPNGQIIDFAIESNFREGLSLTEYIISCYGSRKGVVDTALKTATSGYLTRRLVDVAQHVLIVGNDCQGLKGLRLNTLNVYGRKLLDLKTRLIGRVLSHDVYDKTSLIPRNQELDEALASRLSHHKQILVRSPLTCALTSQVCQLCYGWNLANSRLVSFGVTIGVIAAQSIGEPGTQLTMRTFHTGGVFAGNASASQGIVRCVCVGVVDFPQPCAGLCVKTNMGQVAFLTKLPTVILVKQTLGFQKTHYVHMPSHSLIFVKQGQTVYPDLVLGEIAYLNQPVNQTIETTFSPFSGEICFETFKHLTLLSKEAQSWHQQNILLRKEFQRLDQANIKPLFRVALKKQKRRYHKTLSPAQNRFWLLNLEKQRLLHVCKTFLKPGDLFEKHSALFAYHHKVTQTGLAPKANQAHFYFLPVFFPFMLFKYYDPIKQQRWIKQQDQKPNVLKVKKSHNLRQFRTSYQPKPQVLAREIAWPSTNNLQPFKRLSLNPTPLNVKSTCRKKHRFYTTHSTKSFLASLTVSKAPLNQPKSYGQQQKLNTYVINLAQKPRFSSPVHLKNRVKTFFNTDKGQRFVKKFPRFKRKPAVSRPRQQVDLVLERVRHASFSKSTGLAFSLPTVWSPCVRSVREKYVSFAYDKTQKPAIKYLPMLRPKKRDFVFLANGKRLFSELRQAQATSESNRLPRSGFKKAMKGHNFMDKRLKQTSYALENYIQASKPLTFKRLFIGFNRCFGQIRWRLKRKHVSLKPQVSPVNTGFTLLPRLHMGLNGRLTNLKPESKNPKTSLELKLNQAYHKNRPRSVNMVKKHGHKLLVAPVSENKHHAVFASASVFQEKQQRYTETRYFVWTNKALNLGLLKSYFSETEQNGQKHHNRFKANAMKKLLRIPLPSFRLKQKTSSSSSKKKALFSVRSSTITRQKTCLFFSSNENVPSQRVVSYVTLFANLVFKQQQSTTCGLVFTKQKKRGNFLNAPLNPVNILNLRHYEQPTFCLLLPFRAKASVFRQRFSTESNPLQGKCLTRWQSFVVFEQGKKQQPTLTSMNHNHVLVFHAYHKQRVELKRTKTKVAFSTKVKQTFSKTKLCPWVFLSNPAAYRTTLTKLKPTGLGHRVDRRRQKTRLHASLALRTRLWCHNWRNYGMVFFKTCAKFNHLLKQNQSVNRFKTGSKMPFNPGLKTCAVYYGTTISLDFRGFSEEKQYVKAYLQTKRIYGQASLKTGLKQNLEAIGQHDHFKSYEKTYDHTLTLYHAFFRFLYFQVHKLPVLPLLSHSNRQRRVALSTQKAHSHPWPRYQPSLNLNPNQDQTLNSLNSGAHNPDCFLKEKLNHFHVFLDSAHHLTSSVPLHDKQNPKTRAQHGQTRKPVKRGIVKGFPSFSKTKVPLRPLETAKHLKAKRLTTVNPIRLALFRKQKGDTRLKRNKRRQRFLRQIALENAKTSCWDHGSSRNPFYVRKINQTKTKPVTTVKNQEQVLKKQSLVNLRLQNQRLKWFLHELQCQQARGLALNDLLCFKPTQDQGLGVGFIWFKYCNNYLKFKSVKAVLKHSLLQTRLNVSYAKPCLKPADFRCFNNVKKTNKPRSPLSLGVFALLLNVMATAKLDLCLDLNRFPFHDHPTDDGLTANRLKTKPVNQPLKTTTTLAQLAFKGKSKPELRFSWPCDHTQNFEQNPVMLATEYVERFAQHHTCFPKYYNHVGRILACASDFTLKTKATDLAKARGELIASVPNLKQSDAITQQSSQRITLNVSDQPVTEIYFVNQKNMMNYRLPFKNSHINRVNRVNVNRINRGFVLGSCVHASQKATQHHRFPRSGQVVFLGKNNILLRRANRFLMPAQTKSQLKAFNFVDQHSPLLTLRYKSLTTGDIVQGIPKIERIFEGRNMGQRLTLPALVTRVFNSYRPDLIRDVNYRDRVFFSVLQEVQRFTMDAVQNVYQSQGVNIADKHLEIIIKQMTTRVVVSHPGDTGLLFGEVVYLSWIEFVNRLPIKRALFVPRVHGITKTALKGRGFLAPASFQETVRVLGHAAMLQKRDFLKGLKENVILGYKIPMGTCDPHVFKPTSSGLSLLKLIQDEKGQAELPKKTLENGVTSKPRTHVRFGDVLLDNDD